MSTAAEPAGGQRNRCARTRRGPRADARSAAAWPAVTVDFARLLRRDTLVSHPPQNVSSGLKVLAWAEEALNLVGRTLPL